jgi:hypothetical protein
MTLYDAFGNRKLHHSPLSTKFNQWKKAKQPEAGEGISAVVQRICVIKYNTI